MILSEVIKSSSLPRPESELILAFLLKSRREEIIAHPEKKVSRQLIAGFRRLEKKRLTHWPLAYLFGEKEFYGLNFKLNQSVLVPRPETENLVKYLLDYLSRIYSENKLKQKNQARNLGKIKSQSLPSLSLIDLGTGSGAIIITLAKELIRLRPRLLAASQLLAVDISSMALLLARQNAKNHGLAQKIVFKKSDLLKKVPKSFLSNQNVIIAANLPYLTPKQTSQEKSIKYEPRLALVAGIDGLKYYRRLFQELATKSFNSLFLIGEINPEQSEAVIKAVKRHLPPKKNYQLAFLPDLSGRIRFFTLKL